MSHPMTENTTMSTLVHAAEELVKAACVHVESTSLILAKDTLESLKGIALQSSSSMEKSVDTMKESLTVNTDSIKQLEMKLSALNSNMLNLKDELTNLSKTLEKQATTQRLQWAVGNCDKISHPFFYYSYEMKGKSFDYTKKTSSAIIREILLAFLREDGCDISCRTMSKQNRDEGEKQFRETISKEIQAITGQKPRIGMDQKGYAIYYT